LCECYIIPDCIKALDKAIDDLGAKPETSVDQLILASMASLVEQSTAVVSLLDSGHQKSSFILIRSISEASIHLINLVYFGQEYVDRMIVNSHEELRSMYQFCLDEMEKKLKIGKVFWNTKIAYHKQKRDDFKARYGWKFDKSGTKDAFVLADEKEQYLAYKHMCGRTHADINSLIKDHLEDNDDWVINIGAELDVGDLAIGFRFATEMMLASFSAAFEYFEGEGKLLDTAKAFEASMKSEFDKLEKK
jgi:hypothetical protein